MHIYRLLICCVLAFIQVHTQCQAQTAYLQSNRVFEGDIAELIIQHDSKIPSLYALDTSVLEADFEVLAINSWLARVMESNEVFHRMQWKIEILPRHNGSLSVPALQVGAASTPVLTLEVTPQTPALRSMQNVFLEIQAQPINPYVGQLTQVTIRLLHNIPLSDGNLLEAKTDDADVYRSGKESRYVTSRDGKEFDVLERKFALVVRAPGETRLSAASYRGLIKSAHDASGMASTAQSRRIYRKSEALQLQVRKPPAEFSGGAWLPALQLEISQQWDEIADDLNVGDSLGLSLTIESRGLPAAALPAGLISIKSDKLKIYADQEVRSNRHHDDGLVGRLEQRFAVVITQPGKIVIPATTLKWWDIMRDVERVAKLDGKILIVADPADIRSSDDEFTALRSNRLPAAGFEPATVRGHWQWPLLISLGLLICGLSFYAKPAGARIISKLEPILTTRRTRKALKQACMSNDAAGARRELLKWGRARWPDENINGLHQIEARTDSVALLREFSRLDAALYANHASAWQGRALWRLIAGGRSYHPAGSGSHPNSLQNLYPRQDLPLQTTIR
jgi:hypothetical protein